MNETCQGRLGRRNLETGVDVMGAEGTARRRIHLPDLGFGPQETTFSPAPDDPIDRRAKPKAGSLRFKRRLFS
jgi:hypothetical protein